MEVRDATNAVYRVEPEAACVDDVPPGYKRTEVGVIPEDWKLPLLQMVGTFSKGQGIRKDQASSGSIPCVRYGEIYTHHNDILRKFNSHISERVAQSSVLLKPGDILFAGSGETKEEIGKAVAYVGQGRAYAGGDIVILTPHGFASTFLGYALNAPSVVRQKAARGQGDAVVHITSSALSSVVVPVPPTLAEQQAIAEALSDADALIESLQQLIVKQRALKQGAMQALLTGRQRLPGFAGEWRTNRIGEFTDCTAGGTPSTRIPEYWGGNHRWMNSGELNLKVVSEVEGRITDAGLRNSSTKEVPANCVLIGLAGQGKTRGTAAINTVALCTNQSIAAIFPSYAHISKFLYYVLDTRYEELRELSSGEGGRGGLNLTLIRNLEVPIPSVEEQTVVATVLSDMDAEIEALEARLAKTRALKAGMMQQLLTGRIRLV